MDINFFSPRRFVFCIGAQKAGTTWLYEVLKKHPELFVPPVKELNYCTEIVEGEKWMKKYTSDDWNSKRWRRWIRNNLLELVHQPSAAALWTLLFCLIPRNKHLISIYKLIFSRDKLNLDVSPSYASLKSESWSMIKGSFRDSKILFILRDPIERDWSALKMNLIDHGWASASEFDKKDHTSTLVKYSKYSDYKTTLSSVLKVYDMSNVHICYYDELKKDPQAFLDKVCDFLSVSIIKLPSRSQNPINAGFEKVMSAEYQDLLVKKHADQILWLSQHIGKADGCNYVDNWIGKYGLDKDNGNI
ncbi:MAG: sulfotransferase [Cyclobacteriaceae bacterium]